MPKPILVIADNERPNEVLEIRLDENTEREEIDGIIYARDAVNSRWGFEPGKVLEHLRVNMNNYSAILVSWDYRTLTPKVKEIIGDKVPIIQYDFSTAEARQQTVPTAYDLDEEDLSTILHNELVKSGAVAEPTKR